MELERALHQISEIHSHLARSEVYRGCRSLPLAIAGFVALTAAALQGFVFVPGTATAFVQYWVVIAALCGALSSCETLYKYVFRDGALLRLKTRRAVGQFLPCLLAGAAVTLCVGRAGEEAVTLLPGLWAILFSMGIFASRPYLPRAIGWVGLFYLVAGVALLLLAPSGLSLAPWGMGITFGIGQLSSAVVLYWNIERAVDHD